MRDRVYRLEDQIYIFHDVPRPTIATAEFLLDRVDELIPRAAPYYMVIDLVKTQKPPADVRAYIRRRIDTLANSPTHVAFSIGGNLLTKFGLKLVVRRIYGSVSIHDELAEAVAEVRRKKRDAAV